MSARSGSQQHILASILHPTNRNVLPRYSQIRKVSIALAFYGSSKMSGRTVPQRHWSPDTYGAPASSDALQAAFRMSPSDTRWSVNSQLESWPGHIEMGGQAQHKACGQRRHHKTRNMSITLQTLV